MDGITLIELLVALSISLLVLFAVISIYVPTKQNTRLQAGISRANETAQVATEVVSREFRQIANSGCPSLAATSVVNDSLTDTGVTNAFEMKSDTIVRLLSPSDSGTPATAEAGTAIIDFVHAARDGVHLAAKAADRYSPLYVTGDPGMSAATPSSLNGYPVAVVSTCNAGEIFQVASVAATGIAATPWKVDPLNKLRVPYTLNARVAPATRTQFYVAPFTRASGERSSRALYMRTMRRDLSNWNVGQPIAHDLVSVNVILHLDTDGDYQNDTEVPFGAAYNPSQVVGLTLRFTFETPESVNGTAGARVQRPLTTAISIRARLT